MENWKIFYKNEKFEYSVNENGEIKNSTTGKLLKPQINFQGYFYVRYGGRKHLIKESIHRIVAREFIPNPRKVNVVNHKDGNKLNNHVSNLEWVSQGENMNHVAAMGLIKKQRNKKLSTNEVHDIRTLGLYGFKAKDIARSFCMHENSIRNILNNRYWRHEEIPKLEVYSARACYNDFKEN